MDTVFNELSDSELERAIGEYIKCAGGKVLIRRQSWDPAKEFFAQYEHGNSLGWVATYQFNGMEDHLVLYRALTQDGPSLFIAVFDPDRWDRTIRNVQVMSARDYMRELPSEVFSKGAFTPFYRVPDWTPDLSRSVAMRLVRAPMRLVA